MNEARIGRWLMIGAGLVVVATLVVGISTLGSPSAQRDLRLDERRVRDLDRIVDAVGSYVNTNKTLPPTLGALATQPGRYLSIVDPADGVPYVYRMTGDRTFQLCAVFATDTAQASKHGEPWSDDEWLHGAGRQCFDRRPKSRND